MIYFIQDTTSKAIKIGVSKSPVKRMTELQTAHGAILILVGVMDGNRDDERMLHRRFHRIHGEWFYPSSELLGFIKDCAVVLPAARGVVFRVVPDCVLEKGIEFVPIDLDTVSFDHVTMWLITLTTMQMNMDNDSYRFTPEKVAKLFASVFVRDQRIRMFLYIQQIVLTIRSLPIEQRDAILSNIPDEIHV